MDLILLLKAAILGLVEGITEFLPISSTGHLILTSELLGVHDERGKLFEIVIQSGAILAICWEFRFRFAQLFVDLFPSETNNLEKIHKRQQAWRFFINILIAFLPLAILGLLFGKQIKAVLFNAFIVATTFIIGGIIILWAENRQRTVRVTDLDQLNYLDAFKLGIAQAFALIPGMSRSGSTIIGGLLFGLSRKAATEFSFFLAVPTLLLASLYQLYKERNLLNIGDLPMWLVGFACAFISAFICVRWLLRYIANHDFRWFAWYRILFGCFILLSHQLSWVKWD